jgi:hypothetical protein
VTPNSDPRRVNNQSPQKAKGLTGGSHEPHRESF